jgi:hypothetical protein
MKIHCITVVYVCVSTPSHPSSARPASCSCRPTLAPHLCLGVSNMTDHVLDVWGLISGRSHSSQWLRDPFSLIFNELQGLNRPERGSDQPYPSGAEIQNTCSCTVMSGIRFFYFQLQTKAEEISGWRLMQSACCLSHPFHPH